MNLKFMKPQNLGSLLLNKANQILIYDCQVRSYLITTVNSGIQNNQILTNDDEVCIPRLSSILLAVKII